MPFSDFKKHAVYTRALVDDLMNTPYNWVKGRMVRPMNQLVVAFSLTPGSDPSSGLWNSKAMYRG